MPGASDPVWQKRYTQKGRYIPPEKYPAWQNQIIEICQVPLNIKQIAENTQIANEIIKPVLNRMCFEGYLLRVGAETLRSNLISYVSASAWAENELRQADREAALTWLAHEYFRVFGPARSVDFQWWAGITKEMAQKALAPQLFSNLGDDLLLLKDDLPEFEKTNIYFNDNIDLLPQWDCYTMAYAPDGRERFVAPDRQHKLYGSLGATKGNALGTILINGLASATWSLHFKGTIMQVELDFFSNPGKKVAADVENQLHKIAMLLNARDLVVSLK